MPRQSLAQFHRKRYPVDAIIRTYQSGLSAMDTGLEFGIDSGQIQSILKTAWYHTARESPCDPSADTSVDG